ncbi:MAG TPA: lysozyme inhibitor LprI family protein [Gaiellaceae bacterium]|nr:lysozyme inhibitor LprI family protein [Gaiellaceae bacterium]
MIRESFAQLPCPKKPVSTLDLEGCSERSLVASDGKVNALVARIWQALPATGRADFARGERAWLAYRTASCNAEASKYAGGTLRPVAFLGCEVGRNKTHLTDLGGTLNVLTHP